MLSAMILLPFAGAAFQAAGLSRQASRWVAIGTSVGSALLGLFVLSQVHAAGGGATLVDSFRWIGAYAIHYEVSVDGLTAPILLLISIVFPVLLVSEWERDRQARGLYGLLLLLQGALIGATCAQDLFLLFFFWSLSSLPVFFLVGVWGGPDKERAAFRGLVASSIGNSLIFAAFILVYYSRDPHTFLIRDLMAGAGVGARAISIAGIETTAQSASFLLVCLGMALRAPIWPINGWFWHAAREAPPAVFVGVAGVTVPCAVVIFARLSHQLFPSVFEAASPWIVGVGATCLLVGAVAILSQKRLSLVLAHLVVVHLGLSLLGLGSRNADALVGVIFHQIGIGLAVAALGLLFGSLTRHWRIEEVSSEGVGLIDRAPRAAAVMALSIGAFVGLPGLSGFVGQSLVVMGSFVSRPATLPAVGAGLLLVIYSLFGVFRKVFLGQATAAGDEQAFPARERVQLLPLVLLMLLLGFYPRPILDLIRPAAARLVAGHAPATEAVPEPPPAPAAIPLPPPAPAAGGKAQ